MTNKFLETIHNRVNDSLKVMTHLKSQDINKVNFGYFLVLVKNLKLSRLSKNNLIHKTKQPQEKKIKVP